MKPSDYIRAWKDPDFRASLSAEQRAALPEHPCAEIELGDEDLELVAGASTSEAGTAGCCSQTNDIYCRTFTQYTMDPGTGCLPVVSPISGGA